MRKFEVYLLDGKMILVWAEAVDVSNTHCIIFTTNDITNAIFMTANIAGYREININRERK